MGAVWVPEGSCGTHEIVGSWLNSLATETSPSLRFGRDSGSQWSSAATDPGPPQGPHLVSLTMTEPAFEACFYGGKLCP